MPDLEPGKTPPPQPAHQPFQPISVLGCCEAPPGRGGIIAWMPGWSIGPLQITVGTQPVGPQHAEGVNGLSARGEDLVQMAAHAMVRLEEMVTPRTRIEVTLIAPWRL